MSVYDIKVKRRLRLSNGVASVSTTYNLRSMDLPLYCTGKVTVPMTLSTFLCRTRVSFAGVLTGVNFKFIEHIDWEYVYLGACVNCKCDRG